MRRGAQQCDAQQHGGNQKQADDLPLAVCVRVTHPRA